jgi:hypothetical protein
MVQLTKEVVREIINGVEAEEVRYIEYPAGDHGHQPHLHPGYVPGSPEVVHMCKSCWNSLKGGNLPQFCVNNGLNFGALPPELMGLNAVELRMIAMYTATTAILQLVGGQQARIGGIAFLERDISGLLPSPQMPRSIRDSAMLLVRVGHYQDATQHYTYSVREDKVLKALEWLIANHQCYKERYGKMGVCKTTLKEWTTAKNAVLVIASERENAAAKVELRKQMGYTVLLSVSNVMLLHFVSDVTLQWYLV